MGPLQMEQQEQSENTFWTFVELGWKNYASCRQEISSALETRQPMCHSIGHEWRAQIEKETKRLHASSLQRQDYAAKQDDQIALEELLTRDNNRTEALQKRATELSEILQRQKPLVAERLAESKGVIDQKRKKDSSTLDVIHWYERTVGFRVETSKNKALKFIFTKLSPADINREFSFSIRHDKQTNLYTMLECNPQVARTEELLNELNCTNDLRKFALNVRNEFQGLLQN